MEENRGCNNGFGFGFGFEWIWIIIIIIVIICIFPGMFGSFGFDKC